MENNFSSLFLTPSYSFNPFSYGFQVNIRILGKILYSYNAVHYNIVCYDK